MLWVVQSAKLLETDMIQINAISLVSSSSLLHVHYLMPVLEWEADFPQLEAAYKSLGTPRKPSPSTTTLPTPSTSQTTPKASSRQPAPDTPAGRRFAAIQESLNKDRSGAAPAPTQARVTAPPSKRTATPDPQPLPTPKSTFKPKAEKIITPSQLANANGDDDGMHGS